MAVIDPVQSTTYYLYPHLNRFHVPIDTPNPLTFGPGTDINATNSADGVQNFYDGEAWIITNEGYISATSPVAWPGQGILLDSHEGFGGTVINDASGTIVSGSSVGVAIYGGAGSVTNAGFIKGQGTGVEFDSGGTVTNQSGGSILSNSVGVAINGAGTVTNAGEIYGAVNGVSLNAGGSVTNKSGGKISAGVNIGIDIAGGPASVTNAGTISGGTLSGHANFAITFADVGANTLTLETGSIINGPVLGSALTGATNALVLEGTGTAANTFYSFDTITVQSGASWTLSGANTFDATVNLAGNLTINGDPLANTLSVTGGGILSFAATNSVWNTVYRYNGTIDLGKALVSIVGGGDTVNFQSGFNDEASLYNTGGNWDTVNGSYGTVILNKAQVSVVGGQYTIDFQSGSNNWASLYSTGRMWDTVNGSNGRVVLNGAVTSVEGGGDTIDFQYGAGNEASLIGTNDNWDTVNGSSGTVDLNGAQASLVGGGDIINFTTGPGNETSLYNTVGSWDTVYGSNGLVALNNAQASVVGGNDEVDFQSGSGSAASLYDTGNNWDTVDGSNGAIALTRATASIKGGGDTVYLSGDRSDAASLYATNNNGDTVLGANGTVILNSAQATVSGDHDAVWLTGTSTATLDGGSDYLAALPGIQGHEVVNGFASTDTIFVWRQDFASWSALQGHISQAGADTVIALDAADTITLKNVTAASLTAAQFYFQ